MAADQDTINANVSAVTKVWMGYRLKTQRELASVLGCSASGVTNRFHGQTRFTAAEIVTISRWLGPSLDDLYEGRIPDIGTASGRLPRGSASAGSSLQSLLCVA